MLTRVACVAIVTWALSGLANDAFAQAAVNKGSIAFIGTKEPKLRDFEPGAAANQITIEAADVPGRAEFRIYTSTATTKDWTMTFVVAGVETVVRPDTRTEFHTQPDIVEFPLHALGTIVIKRTPGAPKVRLISLSKLDSRGTTLNISGPFTLRYFDGDFAADPRRKALARGVVQLQFEGYKGLGGCTAFQFAPKYFLTNLHCIENDERPSSKQNENTLVFGALVGQVAGERAVPATVVARGNISDLARPILDYAVLVADVPAAFQNAILALDAHGDSVAVSAPLELYQQWSHRESSPVGKAMTADPSCQVFAVGAMPVDPAEYCPYPMFLHRCAAEGGSSGSPILRRDGNAVIGLHRSGAVGNCGIAAEKIVEDLRQRYHHLNLFP